ncbi:hypothetical protein [Aurantiacibacter gilvus]|uniref:SMP-30/Gluconolactonase/LRE-like region domain-containing protein n=1 Tax=Aurantiacibacter gilvus TaxID=3139141 RepID=A0ABU9IE28_9SPHN
MRKIVQCSIMAITALTLAGCQTPENPFQTMAEPAPVNTAAPPPPSRPPQPWRPVDAATGQITAVDALQNLTAEFPNSSSVRLRLLNAHLAEEDTGRALSVAQVLVQDGYAFTPGALEYLQGLVQTAVVPAWIAAARINAEPIAASEVVAEVPATVLLPESVLHDPATDRFLVTSIVSRGLFVREGEGEWRQVDIPAAGSLAGIAIDQRRGLIWLGSGVVEQTPDPDSAFRGMIALDRTTLEVRRRVPAPAGVTISDIAVGPDGTVFGSDPVGGGVYTASMQDASMTALIAPGTFRSPQGLAVRPDGRSLFVSDYRYGIAVVTLPSRQVYRLQMEEHALLDGVDGLWLYGNELVAMQNGLGPMRLIAITLGGGPASAASYRVIERNHPGWTEPLGGAISGNALVYIGTGQWELFGEGGALAEGLEPQPTAIHRVPLVESEAESLE